MLRRLTAATLALTLCCAGAMAGNLSFKGETDKAEAIYKPGEKMVFSVQALDDSKPVAGKKLKWTRRGDDQKTENGEAVSSDTQPLVISTSMDKPGFVHIAVTLCDENGKPIKNEKGNDVKFEGGAGVELEKLEGVPEPKDFDEFWAKQKARLAEVPMKAEMVEVASPNPNFIVHDVKVDCAGGKRVSGYLAKPKGAAPKSLQAKVGFMGYGVSSPKPDCQTGKITFTINAHGIENGKEADYYKNLQAGELKGYAFKNDENAKPETAYFNGMMLRVLRALEFIKSQPEWDGKNLAADGGSQGGLQSLTAAGLDKDVTSCFAWKPWCCDLGGVTLGRLRGWRPDYTEALNYYDPVNHAKRIKCSTTIISGLGDYVCPPSSITVLYNNIKAPKRIEFIQGSTHMYDPPGAKKFSLKGN